MTDKIERCVEEKGFGLLDGATPREKSSAGMPIESTKLEGTSQTSGTIFLLTSSF